MKSSADILVIDTRVDVEVQFSQGHIPGAEIVTLSQFLVGWAPAVSLNREIILYWSWLNEKTSSRAALELIDKGFTDIKVLKGGYNAWKDAGYPTEGG